MYHDYWDFVFIVWFCEVESAVVAVFLWFDEAFDV